MKLPLRPINKNLEIITLKDIEDHKLRSVEELKKDLNSLKDFDTRTNPNSNYGHKFLYHYQFKNLLKCRRIDSNDTIYEIYSDPEKWNKLLENTRVRNRRSKTAAGNIYECFRINLGSIVMFKSTTAKYLYKKYKATKVLDPTAGWGGRMLGAWSLGIDYTGIDTNIEMKPAYDQMIQFLNNEALEIGNSLFKEENNSKLKMIWQNCLDVNFDNLDYDFVLTSPPYVNLEIYEHMTLWNNESSFYKDFFIPLWKKCIDHIKPNGHVCFNISSKMYESALSYGLPECDIQEDLIEQKRNKKQDKIYIWRQKFH